MPLALEPLTIDNVTWTPVLLPASMQTVEAQRHEITVILGPFPVDVKGRVVAADATREFTLLSFGEEKMPGLFDAGQPVCYLQSASGTHTLTQRFYY